MVMGADRLAEMMHSPVENDTIKYSTAVSIARRPASGYRQCLLGVMHELGKAEEATPAVSVLCLCSKRV